MSPSSVKPAPWAFRSLVVVASSGFRKVKSRLTPFPIPDHWALLWSIDMGVSHPWAATLLAWDRDADVSMSIHCIRMKDSMIIDQVEAIKSYDRKWG